MEWIVGVLFGVPIVVGGWTLVLRNNPKLVTRLGIKEAKP